MYDNPLTISILALSIVVIVAIVAFLDKPIKRWTKGVK